MALKNWIKFAVLAIMWGSNFLWTRIIVKDISPFILVFLRILLAFLTICIYLVATRTRIKLTKKKVGIFFVLGVLNVMLPFLLTAWAEQFITSSLAGIINSTYPLFSLLLAAIFLPEEKISLFRGMGILIGFGGMIILANPSFSGMGTNNYLPGVLVMLLAPISYAAALIFARISTRHLDATEQSLGQLGMALVTIGIATGVFNPQWEWPSMPVVWAGILWLGIICTGVGTILWYSLLNSVGAMRTSLIAYASPIIAVLLGGFILSEEFTWNFVIGGLLVMIGLLWVNLSKPKR